MGIKCFWLEPTDRQKRYLRRYQGSLKCSNPMGYHDAMVFVEESKETMSADGTHWEDDGKTEKDFIGDSRWPTHCFCGYEFQPSDNWQLFSSHIYRRVDTNEEMTLCDAPEGAMWDATWFHDYDAWCGADGRAIICKVPVNHEWHIDGPSSNCPWQGRKHKCWVRHGEPPNLTVDKDGDTCPAGHGSILTAQWHGFLVKGELITIP